jgi:hypothetical protein
MAYTTQDPLGQWSSQLSALLGVTGEQTSRPEPSPAGASAPTWGAPSAPFAVVPPHLSAPPTTSAAPVMSAGYAPAYAPAPSPTGGVDPRTAAGSAWYYGGMTYPSAAPMGAPVSGMMAAVGPPGTHMSVPGYSMAPPASRAPAVADRPYGYAMPPAPAETVGYGPPPADYSHLRAPAPAPGPGQSG